MILEVIVFNLQSARDAAAAGAHRLELCDNFSEGGTTPSIGNLEMTMKEVSIDVYPMVRPRGGDFLYSDAEYQVMENDIRAFRNMGCKGIVLGCLNPDATVNTERLARLVDLAGTMEVHFHRAFDRVQDQFVALEEVIRCGCKRILTSGAKPRAADGVERLKELVSSAGQRITIIPGGDIKSTDFPSLLTCRATEFHTPARRMVPSEMRWTNEEMNEQLAFAGVDIDEIRRILIQAAEKI